MLAESDIRESLTEFVEKAREQTGATIDLDIDKVSKFIVSRVYEAARTEQSNRGMLLQAAVKLIDDDVANGNNVTIRGSERGWLSEGSEGLDTTLWKENLGDLLLHYADTI